MKKEYLFTSKRLGFRNWTTEDVPEFAEMNADDHVMEHFPKPLTPKETAEFVERLQGHYQKKGYSYFAVEILETGEFIGFIGLAFQEYTTAFTPAVDIGWRLKQSAWGKGYATEGAQQCLDHAFNTLKLEKVIATCTLQNVKSEQVMRNIGMQKLGEFEHPKLEAYPAYQRCVCYGITPARWLNH